MIHIIASLSSLCVTASLLIVMSGVFFSRRILHQSFGNPRVIVKCFQNRVWYLSILPRSFARGRALEGTGQQIFAFCLRVSKSQCSAIGRAQERARKVEIWCMEKPLNLSLKWQIFSLFSRTQMLESTISRNVLCILSLRVLCSHQHRSLAHLYFLSEEICFRRSTSLLMPLPPVSSAVAPRPLRLPRR